MSTGSDRTRIVSQEAAYWYLRCSDERAMLRSDRQQFYSWLKRSPENIAEILRISEMDGKFAKRKLIDRVGELEDSNVVSIGTGASASQYDYEPSDSLDDDEPEAAMTSKPGFSWASAAAVLIAVACLLGLMIMNHEPNGTVQTAASQWQHMSLDDGSSVHIDARTRLKIDFLPERRIVHLYAGQAVFDVAKDPKRPFTVSTELVDVTAVGTRFGVAIDPGVTATVSEGVVKVTPPGKHDDDRAAVMLKAGEELHVLGAEVIRVSAADVVKVDAERKLDWANGWLVFRGETVGQAVTEFNRRNAMQIKIEDRVIADRQLIGYYRLRVDAPESFAKLLDSQEGIVVIRDRTSNVLHLQLE